MCKLYYNVQMKNKHTNYLHINHCHETAQLWDATIANFLPSKLSNNMTIVSHSLMHITDSDVFRRALSITAFATMLHRLLFSHILNSVPFLHALTNITA